MTSRTAHCLRAGMKSSVSLQGFTPVRADMRNYSSCHRYSRYLFYLPRDSVNETEGVVPRDAVQGPSARLFVSAVVPSFSWQTGATFLPFFTSI